jgi:Ca2+-binding RTX toxin-like protein
LPATQFAKSTHALSKKDYLFYDAKTGNLYYDADGNGAELAVKIALLGKNLALTADDFIVM